MNYIDTVVLGIVEGLTEFLPVSSTGHLILAGHLLGASGDVASTFEVFIQLGAILAVVVLYRQRFAQLFQFNQIEGFTGLRGWALLAITTFPPALAGLLLHDVIKRDLFNNPAPVLWALGIGGVVIIMVEQLRLRWTIDSMENISYRQALTIGLFQCLSLWPGVSRAAATIIGGLFSGLDRKLATEYSFIAAVPLMCLATSYDLVKSLNYLHWSDLPYFAVGFGVAFISAMVAIKFFIRLVQHWSLVPFGVYRIVIAVLFFWVMRTH